MGTDRPGFFDDLLGIAVRAPNSDERVAQLKAALEGPTAPRSHPCARCSKLNSEARRRGEPETPVAECERLVKPDGRVYHAGTCAQCTDIEWSEKWTAHYAEALKASDTATQRILTQAAIDWQKRGRKFYGKTQAEGPKP